MLQVKEVTAFRCKDGTLTESFHTAALRDLQYDFARSMKPYLTQEAIDQVMRYSRTIRDSLNVYLEGIEEANKRA